MLSAGEIASMAATVERILTETASIYVEGDNYAVAVKMDLACRLNHVNANAALGGNERAELLELRRLVWTPDYEMPVGAQVEIESRRWNTVRGTFKLTGDFGATGIVRSCDVRPV